jgi:hypothetical protein
MMRIPPFCSPEYSQANTAGCTVGVVKKYLDGDDPSVTLTPCPQPDPNGLARITPPVK